VVSLPRESSTQDWSIQRIQKTKKQINKKWKVKQDEIGIPLSLLDNFGCKSRRTSLGESNMSSTLPTPMCLSLSQEGPAQKVQPTPSESYLWNPLLLKIKNLRNPGIISNTIYQ